MAMADHQQSLTASKLPMNKRGFSLIDSKVGAVGPSAVMRN